MLAFIIIAAFAVAWFAINRRRADRAPDRVALRVRTNDRPQPIRRRRR